MNEVLAEVVCEDIERDRRTGEAVRTRTRGLGTPKAFFGPLSERLGWITVTEAPTLERHDDVTLACFGFPTGEERQVIDDDLHVACLMKDIVLGRGHAPSAERRSAILKHIDRFVECRNHVVTRAYRLHDDGRLSMVFEYRLPGICTGITAVRLSPDAAAAFAEKYLSEAYRPPAPSGDGIVLRGWSEDMAVRMDAADVLTAQWDHLEGIADRAERLATETRADGNRLGISEWRLESLPALRAVLDRAVEEGLAERTCERGVEMWRSKA